MADVMDLVGGGLIFLETDQAYICSMDDFTGVG